MQSLDSACYYKGFGFDLQIYDFSGHSFAQLFIVDRAGTQGQIAYQDGTWLARCFGHGSETQLRLPLSSNKHWNRNKINPSNDSAYILI